MENILNSLKWIVYRCSRRAWMSKTKTSKGHRV